MGLFIAQHAGGLWAVLATFITAGIVAALWLGLLPRGWWRSLDESEKRLATAYLALRALMPLVFQFLGQNASTFFSGGWDARSYHSQGARIARQLIDVGIATAGREIPGTGSVNIAVGWFYFLIGGPFQILGMYAWTALSTIGVLLFWLATRHLVTRRRNIYGALLLFAPTLLFWNAGLGKDALIMLGLGCLVASVQLFLARRSQSRALIYLVGGTFAIGMIRPFIAGMFFLAVLIGVIVADRRRITFGSRLFVALLLLGGMTIAYSQTSELLKSENSQTSVLDSAYQRAEATAAGQGRSAYSTTPTRSIGQVPNAVATVLFRPFPWEVRTPLQLLTSLESLAVMGLAIWALSRVYVGRESYPRDPLVIASAAYVLLFCSAVVSYGNFGLIARQRMQVWPFILLLVFAATHRGRSPSGSLRTIATAQRRDPSVRT